MTSGMIQIGQSLRYAVEQDNGTRRVFGSWMVRYHYVPRASDFDDTVGHHRFCEIAGVGV